MTCYSVFLSSKVLIELIDSLIPISICVVLPVLIVWLALRNRRHEVDRKTEVMLKAIEAGSAIDANFFPTQRSKGIKERMLSRLTAACVTSLLGIVFLAFGIFFCNRFGWRMQDSPSPLLPVIGGILLAVGIALFICYYVGMKMLAKEIEAEEKMLESSDK